MRIPDLQPYTGQDEWFKAPFTVVDIKGTVWNIATDRAGIVAVKGKGRYPRWSGNMAQLNVMLGLLQSLPVEPRVVGAPTLKQWTSSGEIGKVMGAIIDLRKLGRLLNLFPAEGDLQIWDASSVMREDPCLGMGAQNIRAFLMGQVQITTTNVFDTLKLTRTVEEKPVESRPEWAGFDLVMSMDED
jgi:hypothetical protein